MIKDELKNRVLNGGRGSGQSLRLLVEVYENQIVELQSKVDTLQGFLDHDIEYDMDKTIQEQKIKIKDLEKQIADLEWQLQEVVKDNDYYQTENIELEEEMNAKQVVLNDFKSRVETVTDRFDKKSSQLTKAKEIISEFVEWANWQGSKCPSFKSIQDKAEKFLSEVEK